MSDKPNVLLVTFDHWPGRLLGAAGHPVIQTPTLDALANCGTRFTRAYTECPVCIPARRTLMTGTTPRTHGDRIYSDRMRMPQVPTLAQTFRNAGYQAFASGKLHVYPQRDRIGFDDVMLGEEGRIQFGTVDDYELFLGSQGHAGKQFFHGMGNNDHSTRPWHLSEDQHITNWTTREMVRFIQRRDPTRPGFYYLSYCHPHPPLVPLQCYLDMYRDIPIDTPLSASWSSKDTPGYISSRQKPDAAQWWIDAARRAFYALCTHIDHQLRIVIGALREEKLLDNTVIMITGDHGDMLGNHGLWGKRLFYEYSANVPMIVIGRRKDSRVQWQHTDNRLVGLQDIMPTLLDLCDITVPSSVEGLSMLSNTPRPMLYGEIGNDANSTRMVHDGRHKLIYCARGNLVQLFDIESDPGELNDLSNSSEFAHAREKLTAMLISNLYGGDEAWVHDGKLVGLPSATAQSARPDPGLSGQRGSHWPLPNSSGL